MRVKHAYRTYLKINMENKETWTQTAVMLARIRYDHLGSFSRWAISNWASSTIDCCRCFESRGQENVKWTVNTGPGIQKPMEHAVFSHGASNSWGFNGFNLMVFHVKKHENTGGSKHEYPAPPWDLWELLSARCPRKGPQLSNANEAPGKKIWLCLSIVSHGSNKLKPCKPRSSSSFLYAGVLGIPILAPISSWLLVQNSLDTFSFVVCFCLLYTPVHPTGIFEDDYASRISKQQAVDPVVQFEILCN